MTKSKRIPPDQLFVIKIQRSLASTRGPQMLIYNKSRSIQYEAPLTADIAKLMGEDYKIFAHTTIDKAGMLHIAGRTSQEYDW